MPTTELVHGSLWSDRRADLVRRAEEYVRAKCIDPAAIP